MQVEDGKSCDAVFGGALKIWQRKKGYRFGLDSLLLATDLPEVGEGARVVELGAGQGAVALTIGLQHPTWEVRAVERHAGLYELLEENIAENGLGNVTAVRGDLREYRGLLEAHWADLVVANPPYFVEGARRASANEERAAARHELFGGLREFVEAAGYVLKQRGWLQVIVPPVRLEDALRAAIGTDLKLASLRSYHSYAGDDAYLVEIRWRRGGAPDLKIRGGLVVYADGEGRYSEEVARRLGKERR